jgi:hypothetical protein
MRTFALPHCAAKAIGSLATRCQCNEVHDSRDLRGYGWQKGGQLAEGTPNFAVLKEWNRAQVYQKTIALFSQRLASE